MIRVKRRGSSTELEGFPELAVLEPDALGIEITAGPTVQNMGKGNSPQGRESRMIWGAVNDGTSQPTVGYAGPDAEVSIVGWNFDTEIMGLPNNFQEILTTPQIGAARGYGGRGYGGGGGAVAKLPRAVAPRSPSQSIAERNAARERSAARLRAAFAQEMAKKRAADAAMEAAPEEEWGEGEESAEGIGAEPLLPKATRSEESSGMLGRGGRRPRPRTPIAPRAIAGFQIITSGADGLEVMRALHHSLKGRDLPEAERRMAQGKLDGMLRVIGQKHRDLPEFRRLERALRVMTNRGRVMTSAELLNLSENMIALNKFLKMHRASVGDEETIVDKTLQSETARVWRSLHNFINSRLLGR